MTAEEVITRARRPNKKRRSRSVPSERDLMTGLATVMWLSSTIIVFGASFFDEVAPENLNFWRLALGLPALLLGISFPLLARRLSDRAFQLYIELNMIPALVIDLILLQITPATQGVLLSMVVPLLFAGYFLRSLPLLLTLGSAVLIALSTLSTEPASQTPHLGSFLVVYIAIAIVTPLLLHLQNRETFRAVALLRRGAASDPLTGLANWRGLRREFRRLSASRSVRRGDRLLAVLVIDLDNFKSANSAYGHIGGDHALRAIAGQLKRLARPGSCVARIGGDEFAVLIGVESPARAIEAGEMFQAAVRAACATMELPGASIAATVGIAIQPEDGDDLESLIDAADRRMYELKGEKRHQNLPDSNPAAAEVRPPWLREAVPEVEADGPEPLTLDTIAGGKLRFLASRTLFARASSLGWAFGAPVMALSLLVPDAYPDPALTWWMVLLIGAVMTPATLIANRDPGTRTHLFLDAATLAIFAGAIAATGGLASTAGPLLILLAASQAWFWNTRFYVFRVIGPVAAALSPFLYSPLTGDSEHTAMMLTALSLSVLLVTLVTAMYFDRYLLTRLQLHIEQMAVTDPLTGIANRRRFESYVQEQLAAVDDAAFAIVMLDLDNFKEVNSRHGHAAGDRTLKSIATALSSVARADDCIARIGGDEFAAVLSGVQAADAQVLADRFVEAVASAPEAHSEGVGASAGFAIYPVHGQTLDELMHVADNALMAVKASGKGVVRAAPLSVAVN